MLTTSRETDYVLNKINGDVTIRELLEYTQCNVDTWSSEPVLWDLTNATLKEDKSDYIAIRNIVSKKHSLAEKRKGKKTVFVAPDPYSYGMLRVTIAIVGINMPRSVTSVFYDIESAEEWLKEA